jgi:hypothetical protein
VFARVAAFEGGDTERLRQLNEEQMAAGTMAFPDGVRRVLVLSDQDGVRRLFISFFDSREAVESAEQQFEQKGDEIPEEVRGRRTSVKVYEVVFDQPT